MRRNSSRNHSDGSGVIEGAQYAAPWNSPADDVSQGHLFDAEHADWDKVGAMLDTINEGTVSLPNATVTDDHVREYDRIAKAVAKEMRSTLRLATADGTDVISARRVKFYKWTLTDLNGAVMLLGVNNARRFVSLYADAGNTGVIKLSAETFSINNDQSAAPLSSVALTLYHTDELYALPSLTNQTLYAVEHLAQ